MKIKVIRHFKGEQYTIGRLYIDDVYYCDTLEDRVRDFEKDGKVFGQTAIPQGIYDLKLSMSPRFGRLLPEILNVPHFTGIRIHRGNTHFDTHGCILVGFNKEKGKVLQSSETEMALINRLAKANDKITIEIS
jgi:hypothetical protein